MNGYDMKEPNSLWQSFIRGSDEAFAKLYESHSRQMYHYGIHFCDDTAIIEDAIHDIFFIMYTNRDRLHDLKNVKGYLLIAMRNALINRTQCKNFRFRLNISSCSYVQDKTQNAESNMEKDEEYYLHKRLIAEIEKILSPRQKQAVYYRFSESLPYRDIGILMEITTQSARNLVHSAIKKIREIHPGLSDNILSDKTS